MKKFLSLLLAVMMLLSCTTAMAESTVNVDNITNVDHEDWDGADGSTTADIDAYDSVLYNDADAYDTKGEIGTELWMQVSADGQIDVTVPLVLVFQTNIDGGKAQTGDEYKITNNNSAEVVVTKIEFNKTDFGGEGTDESELMELVEYSENAPLAENQYMVQFEVKENTTGELVLNRSISNGDETAALKMNIYKDADTTTPTQDDNSGEYDVYNYAYYKPASEAGLFKLRKKADTANAQDQAEVTVIDVSMETGRLNFVTKMKDKEAPGENDEQEFDNTKGVHLMTTTYTVAIDTSRQYGTDILGANKDKSGAADYGYLTNASRDYTVHVFDEGSNTLDTATPADNEGNTVNDKDHNNYEAGDDSQG